VREIKFRVWDDEDQKEQIIKDWNQRIYDEI